MEKQSRREFPRSTGGVAAGTLAMWTGLTSIGCASRGPESGKRKPNVVLVITYDQGYGDIAAHGNPYIKTPTLDALRGQSVWLTNIHVDPSCSPSLAALPTGMAGMMKQQEPATP